MFLYLPRPETTYKALTAVASFILSTEAIAQTLDVTSNQKELLLHPQWVWWITGASLTVLFSFLAWTATVRQELRQRRKTDEILAERTAELQLNERRLNMLLALSKSIPKLTEKEILERALDIAVEVTKSKVGYLHLVNNDQKTLALSTWNQTTLKGCTAAHNDHYPITEAGIWADSIRLMRPVVHNDYQNEPLKKGYPRGHFPVIRHMSTPVTDGQKVSLVIGVGNKETDYTPADIIQLQSVANDIEKMVMRRRTEKALKSAKEEAEAANEAKSRFLAEMSHDLRTPLNAIMGFSDMMRSQSFGPLGSPKYEEYANDIYDSGTLLVSLINDVLDVAKIEAGKYALVEEDLSIASTVKTSIRQLKKMAETSGQTLSAKIEPEHLSMRGDGRALIQVFNNLLSNAIKFSPANSTINLEAGLNGDKEVVIKIVDQGIGMSEEGIKKALQPFEQADGLHSRRHEGTGLGLHLCANFMKLFGGTLDIESCIGEGTIIKLTFPSERTLAV